MKTVTLPMSQLYIYAYPAQMITFQLMNDNKIYSNENYNYEDIIRTISRYLKEYPINDIFIIGETVFADKVETIVKESFDYQVNIKRIKA